MQKETNNQYKWTMLLDLSSEISWAADAGGGPEIGEFSVRSEEMLQNDFGAWCDNFAAKKNNK